MRTLVIGDHFIGADVHIDALRERLGPDFGPLLTCPLPGTKAEQHTLQHVMEFSGVAAVDIDPSIAEQMAAATLLIVHFAPVALTDLPKDSPLRTVFVARSGVENVDVETASARGIGVVNVHGRNASAVAELAIGLMLSEGRNIARAHQSIQAGDWRKEFRLPSRELGDSVIGLVGFGHVGRQIASRLRGFGSRLLVADPHVSPEVVTGHGAEHVSLEQLFTASDFVSVQARLTAATHGLIDRRLLGLMKPSAYLVNVGRSRMVDTDALVEALADERIGGAGLDVHDQEPLPTESPLRRLDNVTLTTHFGGDTLQTNRRSAQLVAQAVDEFRRSGRVASAVNAEKIGWAS